jgi:hypothetical protein
MWLTPGRRRYRIHGNLQFHQRVQRAIGRVDDVDDARCSRERAEVFLAYAVLQVAKPRVLLSDTTLHECHATVSDTCGMARLQRTRDTHTRTN